MEPMIFLWALIGPVISLIIAFPITVITKDNSLVDIGWVLGFVSMPWIGYIITGLNNPGTWLSVRQLTMNILITIWGIQLLTYYIIRRLIRRTEDKRFSGFREQWTKNFYLKTILFIFIPQIFLVYIIGSPAVFANSFIDTTTTMEPFEYILFIIGAVVWLEGFLIETISNIQVLRFRKDPANQGRILNAGLWKFSRHPNYFGEIEQWWGIFIIAISYAFADFANTGYLIAGWLTILGPMLLTFILLKVSGVNTLEREGILMGREGYDEYLSTTSKLIPWFPKKKKS
jgi:steroid 5-alpha reductase family enzyme